jgi:hypothetical protein
VAWLTVTGAVPELLTTTGLVTALPTRDVPKFTLAGAASFPTPLPMPESGTFILLGSEPAPVVEAERDILPEM